MNLTDEQKRTLRMEFRRALAGSAQLLRQREALWRQSIGVQILGCDGRLTERMSAVRCPHFAGGDDAAGSECTALKRLYALARLCHVCVHAVADARCQVGLAERALHRT